MFVDSLDIKEFRGIKYCKEPIKFSNFTVLIGRNNSGKSTILEALSLLPGLSYTDASFNQNKLSILEHLHSFNNLLYQYAGTSLLEYQINEKILRIELSLGKRNTTYDGKTAGNAATDFFQVAPDKFPNMVQFIPFDTTILKEIEFRMGQYKAEITKKGYHIKLAEFLRKCVNDEYSEIIFLNPIILRRVYKENIVYLQLRDLGTGAEKVIKIMALMELIKPKLILIDDFEAGLHPSMIKLFLQWLNEKDCQTIISTHSIDVLYHLVDIGPKDTTILQMNKSNEDILSSKSLTLDQLDDLLNSHMDPRLLPDALNL